MMVPVFQFVSLLGEEGSGVDRSSFLRLRDLLIGNCLLFVFRYLLLTRLSSPARIPYLSEEDRQALLMKCTPLYENPEFHSLVVALLSSMNEIETSQLALAMRVPGIYSVSPLSRIYLSYVLLHRIFSSVFLDLFATNSGVKVLMYFDKR